MTQNSINDDHTPWIAYHEEKDLLTATHSVTDSDGNSASVTRTVGVSASGISNDII